MFRCKLAGSLGREPPREGDGAASEVGPVSIPHSNQPSKPRQAGRSTGGTRKPRAPGQAAAKGYDCTLRMPRQEIDSIRAQLDAGSAKGGAESQRQYRRWPFERHPVTVRMSHPGGMVTTLQYACRNLSNGGMSILHSSFVHHGTRCVVTLPHAASGTVEVHGEVMRCRHCRGKVHEIGIRFDQSVDIREILALDPSDNSLVLESVQPESLAGSVLIVDDSELDRVFIRKCLADTQINITAVTTGSEGLERAKERFDLIICDSELPDLTGAEFIGKLRFDGNHTPVIMVSADPGLKKSLAGTAGAPDCFVPKPFKVQRLLGSIAQFLLADGTEGTGLMYSSLESTDPAYSLLDSFAAEVRKLAKELTLAMMRDDTSACRRIAFQLKGSAATFGYAALGEIAGQAYASLSATESAVESRPELDRLLGACGRVRERQAA